MQERYIETCSGSGLEVLIPRKIGQLEFVSILGVGANAVVYEGRHVSTGQCYACKAFNRENMKDDYQKYLIEQELRANELLQNPHIVSIKDTLYDEKVIVLVMEKCRKSLLSSLSSVYPLCADRARFLFCQMLLVVEYLHERNISHGDIKPDNLLFDDNFDLKLADFGCVCLNGRRIYGGTAGTLLYMAPELLDDTDDVADRRPADIWALGIVLFAMSSGRLPWREGTNEDLQEQIRNAEITFPEDFSDDVVDIICRCCARDPKDRPTVFELMNHLYLADCIQSLREKEWLASPAAPGTRQNTDKRFLMRPIRRFRPVKSDTRTLTNLKSRSKRLLISAAKSAGILAAKPGIRRVQASSMAVMPRSMLF